MSLTHIAIATVSVSDQDTALEFYVNKLGFTVHVDTPMGEGQRWLEVGLPGAQTHLVLAHGYGSSDDQTAGKFTGLVLDADDIQATYETLRDRGVAFSEPPTPQPWGMVQAIFADQDGNTFVLVGGRADAAQGGAAPSADAAE
jgi:catechol 2,3-dioxygenase-like lactoylglutathione lyase family enzyme